MPELFISYSRKDKEFVRKLHERLVAQKRDVWVDFEDIPLASDWRREIFQGIEAADSFVFVISPDSIKSEVCDEEVNHAINNKKRLIPIFYRDGEYKNMHQALSSHNWIYFRDTDDFEAAFKSFSDTLDTDLSHVRAHTRLLVRAKEWESKNRNESFLLSGTDLQDAERWLAESVDKLPTPTALQVSYLQASRRASARRIRRLIQAMVAALVITAGLAIFAFNQSQEAQRNAELAQKNAELAQANADVAQKNEAAAKNAEATAKANEIAAGKAEANAKANEVIAKNAEATAKANEIAAENAESTAKANEAAANSAKATAQANYLRAEMQKLGAASLAVIESEGNEGAELATLLAIRSLKMGYNFQAENGLIRALNLLYPSWPLVGHTDVVTSVAITPDTKFVVTGSADRTVRIWDTLSGKEIRQLKGHTGKVTGVAVIDYEEDWIVSTSDDGTVRLWDLATGKELGQLVGHSGPVKCVSVAKNWPYIVTGGADRTVRFWDPLTLKERFRYTEHSGAITSIALSPGGRFVLSGSADGKVKVWDVVANKTVSDWSAGGQADQKTITSVTFNRDFTAIMYGTPNNQYGLAPLNLLPPDQVDGGGSGGGGGGGGGRPGFSSTNAIVTYAADGRTLIVSLGDPDVFSPDNDLYGLYEGHTDSVTSIVASSDSNYIVTGSYDKTARIWFIEPGDGLRRLDVGNTSADGKWIWTVRQEQNEQALIVLDTSTTQEALIVEQSAGEQIGGYFSPDSKTILVIGPDEVQLFEISSRKTLRTYQVEGKPVAAGFSQDGKLIAIVGRDQHVSLLETETGKVRRRLVTTIDTSANYAPSITFSLDNNYLVLRNSLDGEVWNLAAPSDQPIFTGDTVRQIEFSPNSKVLFISLRDYQEDQQKLS